MSSTLARIDKKLYKKLEEFLTNQLKQEKKIKRGKTKNEKQKKNEE